MGNVGLEVPGLWVDVDRVEHIPNQATTTNRTHQFAYYITIHNDSLETVQIRGRRWVVTNIHGHRLVIEGDGVVGQFPKLIPGDTFHYHSYHLIESDSTAEGIYLGLDEQGEQVIARIPSFDMKIPRT
jgi:ApaG protein